MSLVFLLCSNIGNHRSSATYLNSSSYHISYCTSVHICSSISFHGIHLFHPFPTIHIHIIHILRKRWHVSIVLFCLVYSPIFSGEPLRLAAKGTDLRRLPKCISCIASFLWAQRGLDATKSGSSPKKKSWEFHGNICNLTGFRGI